MTQMTEMTEMTALAALEPWAQTATTALHGYGLGDAESVLLSLRENAVFRVTSPDGQRKVLRLCRPGYRTIDEIRSEVAWVTALHDDQIVAVPAVYPNLAGELVHTFLQDGIVQAAVLTEYVDGREPTLDDATEVFISLGRLSAQLHAHGAAWLRPEGWTRPIWDIDALVGPGARWGDWRLSRHLTVETASLFTRAELQIRRRLNGPGSDALTTTLVHADLHPGNLLSHDRGLTLIDFDDCGTSWPLWELACAIVNGALDPNLADHWLAGYVSVRELSAADLDTAGSLIMLRTMMVIGWLESHRHAIPDGQAAELVDASTDLAQAYLAGDVGQLS